MALFGKQEHERSELRVRAEPGRRRQKKHHKLTTLRGLPLGTILASGPVSPTAKGVRKQNHSSGIYGISLVSPKTLLALKGNREISVLTFDQSSQSIVSDEVIVATHSKELYGIRAASSKTDGEFVTWSADGIVRFWSGEGVCKSETAVQECDASSGLTIACVDDEKNILVVGDSTGVVRFIDLTTKSVIRTFQAHGSRVVDLDYRILPDGRQFFISSSRDRTIQIYLGPSDEVGEWTLHQTLEAHKGNIIATRITNDGQRIISCAADRTVNIHKVVIDAENGNKFVGFISERIISLKSTPSDMCLDPQSDKFVVSSDKQIFVYRVSSGDLVTSYRTVDNSFLNMGIVNKSGESVNLATISLGCLNERVYLAGMGNDKSVRLYEHPSGVLIGSDWGHSEGISGLTWVYSNGSTMLASSGNDGCIFLWDVKVENAQQVSGMSSPTSLPVAKLSPTRKILSKAELAKFMPAQSVNRSNKTPSPRRGTLGPSPINKTILPVSSTSIRSSSKTSEHDGSPVPKSNRSISPSRPTTKPTSRYGSLATTTSATATATASTTNKVKPSIGSRLRQSIVPKTASGPRRTLSSSKSFPALSTISKEPPPKNSTPDPGLDNLQKALVSFRNNYSRDVINYEKNNKDELKLLCQELKDTLKLIDPSYQEETGIPASTLRKTIPRSRSATSSLNKIINDNPDMQEFRDMFEQFGDKFFSVVASRINAANDNTASELSTPSLSRSQSPYFQSFEE